MSSQPYFKLKLIIETSTSSPKETIDFGKQIGKIVKKGDFIALIGNLGSGKTTLTRGIASVFVDDNYVKSPSFTIVNEYVAKDKFTLFHLDLYRVDESALDDIGFIEFLEKGAVVVEWPEKMKNFVPENALHIFLEEVDENTRKIRVFGDRDWEERISKIFQKK